MWSTMRSAAARSVRAGTLAAGARRFASAAGPAAAASRVRALSQASRRSSSVGVVLFRQVARAQQVRSFGVTTANAAAKAAGAKKTAGRKKVAGKKTTKKAVPKKKAVKAAAKKKVRKELSPEEKKKLQIRTLKPVALLKEPSKLPVHPWMLYMTENTKGTKMETDASGRANIGVAAAELSRAYKLLPQSELDRLRATVDKNREANAVAYKAWVESHTAQQIADANRARLFLKRLQATKKPLIQDERQPKRPLTPFTLFTKARWATGEFTGQPIGSVAKTMAAEWKSLSPDERLPYDNAGKAESERYEQELQSILGRSVHRSVSPSP